MKETIVLGVGNVLQKDDGIGVYAATYLEHNFTCKPNVRFINGGVEGINLLNTFLECERIIVLDTLMLDDAPGSIYNIPVHELEGLGVNSGGAHEVGVLQVFEMIELLGHTMPECQLIGIIPEHITFEMALSETLHVRFQEYIHAVMGQLNAWGIELKFSDTPLTLRRIIETTRYPETLLGAEIVDAFDPIEDM